MSFEFRIWKKKEKDYENRPVFIDQNGMIALIKVENDDVIMQPVNKADVAVELKVASLGLDVNGKEVYVGDVVQNVETGTEYVVTDDSVDNTIYLFCQESEAYVGLDHVSPGTFKVLGNIHMYKKGKYTK